MTFRHNWSSSHRLSRTVVFLGRLSRSDGSPSRRSRAAQPPPSPASAPSRLLVYLDCVAAALLPHYLGPRTDAACEETAAGKGWIFPCPRHHRRLVFPTLSTRSPRSSSTPCSAFDPTCPSSPLLPSEPIPNQGHCVGLLQLGLPPRHRLQLMRQGHGASPHALCCQQPVGRWFRWTRCWGSPRASCWSSSGLLRHDEQDRSSCIYFILAFRLVYEANCCENTRILGNSLYSIPHLTAHTSKCLSFLV
jgi:hypothetical protein